MIIYEPIKQSLAEFLESYNHINPIDVDKGFQIIKEYKEQKNKYFEHLCGKWYKALSNGRIDYSVYNDKYYFTDLWYCWKKYSRDYLKEIVRNTSLLKLWGVKSVADIGCGIGYTTMALKEIFPEADVFGTNLHDTKQYKYCEYMSKKAGFKLVGSIYDIKHGVDLVFASEYFEHIENPIEHLEEIISMLNPKYFIIANSFNTHSIGHFREYQHRGIKIGQQKISRHFNNALRGHGYIKEKTGFWNNRPTVWTKNFSQIKLFWA